MSNQFVEPGTDGPSQPFLLLRPGRVATVFWICVTIGAALAVMIYNRGPLFADDLAAKLERGRNGSGLYPTLIYAASASVGLYAWAVAQAALLVGAIWLPVRVSIREIGAQLPPAPMLAAPVLAGSLGALPFIAGFLSADVFAPVMLLAIATLAVFSREMTRAEQIAAVVLAGVSVLMHTTLPLISLLLVPVAGVVSVLLARRRWWLAPVLVGAVAAAGFLGKAMSDDGGRADPVPDLAFRLIADGPGYRLMTEACPGAAPECALFSELPGRTTTPGVVLAQAGVSAGEIAETWRRLDPAARDAFAAGHQDFVMRVFAAEPVDVIAALMARTLVQANRFEIGVTIPGAETRDRLRAESDLVPAWTDGVRLTGGRGWIVPLTAFHTLVYAVSALLIVVLTVLPQTAPPMRMRALVLVILAGIMANALVASAFYQPTQALGARTAFLLPIGLSFLLMFYTGGPVQQRR